MITSEELTPPPPVTPPPPSDDEYVILDNDYMNISKPSNVIRLGKEKTLKLLMKNNELENKKSSFISNSIIGLGSFCVSVGLTLGILSVINT